MWERPINCVVFPDFVFVITEEQMVQQAPQIQKNTAMNPLEWKGYKIVISANFGVHL